MKTDIQIKGRMTELARLIAETESGRDWILEGALATDNVLALVDAALRNTVVVKRRIDCTDLIKEWVTELEQLSVEYPHLRLDALQALEDARSNSITP